LEFKSLFKYRNLYMAVAILFVVSNHARPFLTFEPVKILVSYMYCSIEMFFFCSGLGCWFSYSKNPDSLDFLKRRALRIFSIYLPFMVYWLYSVYRTDGISLVSAFANVVGLQWFTGTAPVFNWYIAALWLLYLSVPFLVPLAQKADTRLRGILGVLGLLLLSFAFLGDYYLIIIMARFPSFFVGMLFAAESRRREALTKKETAFLLLLVPVALALMWKLGSLPENLLWDYGLYWYPCLLLTPGLLMILAYMGRALERFSIGRRVLSAVSFIGSYTFEIFLTHYPAQSLANNLLQYILYTAVFAAALHLISRLVRRLFDAAGNGLKKLHI